MCKGYDRYHLFCKWETNSKFEMFYKILTLLKKEKRRLKLPDENVRYMLGKMQQLQVVPYHHYESKFILSCSTKNIEVFYEILGTNINEKYISSIVFGVDRLIKYFIENPGVTINMIITLSFIINAVVFHLCEKIENELSLSDNKIGFKLIYDIQHCKTATDFFEKYLNTNSIVNFDKDCSKDITFTHFKRIYKIKPAK